MGSPDTKDAQPVIDLFKYICSIMGPANKLHVISATRLAMVNHVMKTGQELQELYRKMELPDHLAKEDALKNSLLLEECTNLGRNLTNLTQTLTG